MSTVKGKGTGAPRRTKKAKIQGGIISQRSNGSSAHKGATDAGLNTEVIQMRAYEFFIKRGSTHGDDLADWFKAEQELRTESGF
jgi:hypothetical protein